LKNASLRLGLSGVCIAHGKLVAYEDAKCRMTMYGTSFNQRFAWCPNEALSRVRRSASDDEFTIDAAREIPIVTDEITLLVEAFPANRNFVSSNDLRPISI
jgi:hypothetical protein